MRTDGDAFSNIVNSSWVFVLFVGRMWRFQFLNPVQELLHGLIICVRSCFQLLDSGHSATLIVT